MQKGKENEKVRGEENRWDWKKRRSVFLMFCPRR